MNLKLYNNIESFSNDNISRSSLVNCKKRISIIKTQTLNEHGYREMMQKKKEIKNSLLSSHNNYIYNNTVHSLRGVEWTVDEKGKLPLPSSFAYGIQAMGSFNEIINNTI